MDHAQDTDKTRALGAPAPARESVCPYCGSDIPLGEKYCPECGYETGSITAPGEAAPSAMPSAAVVEITAAGEVFGIGEGEHVLGRSEGALVVSNPFLSRKHLAFIVRGIRLFVRDLGSTNGTFVDGAKLAADEERELHAASELKAGELGINLRWLGVPAGADAAPIVEEQIPGLREDSIEVSEVTSPWSLKCGEFIYPLPFGQVRLGRKPERNDIAFPDDGFMSAAHMLLDVDLEILKAQDLGSTNGSLLNGDKFVPREWREIAAGDTVTIGKTELVVQQAATAQEAAPAAETPAEPESEQPAP
jgi:pSer/pThr/pTyr-binding forkhead associated (FHA) protein